MYFETIRGELCAWQKQMQLAQLLMPALTVFPRQLASLTSSQDLALIRAPAKRTEEVLSSEEKKTSRLLAPI